MFYYSILFQSVKQSSIQIDMRLMNAVDLIEPDVLRLGPGNRWSNVLDKFPQSKYTYIHGTCSDVGVGGYLMGGGECYLFIIIKVTITTISETNPSDFI